MQVVKVQAADHRARLGVLDGESIRPLRDDAGIGSIFELLEADEPARILRDAIADVEPISLADARLLAPIDHQEVWAAGVTYRRSMKARMEESEGAAQFYDKVYVADRPELFFKANPHRVVGPGEAVRIRTDARWNVPEPEFALVVNSRKRIVGYTIGNDMSSRDIEGENPLYLPQAKVYDQCCALGPGIVLAEPEESFAAAKIGLRIERHGGIAFEGETSTAQMARSFDDLVGWLTRECSFPTGAILLTGTGIVPSDEFTLHAGDVIEIAIEGLGVLRNPVVQGR